MSGVRYLRLLLGILGLHACLGLAAEKPSANGSLDFVFDQVDVRVFVRSVSEMTGNRNRYIVDQNVQGKVTVMYQQVPAADVFPIFVSILESIGCAVIPEGEGNVYRIVARATAPMVSVPVIGPDEQVPEFGVFTKIIRLQFLAAEEMAKLLEKKVPGGKEGAVGAIKSGNYLMITDEAGNIRRIEKIVSEVDKPGLSRNAEVVTLTYAGAEDVAEQLTAAMAQEDTREGTAQQRYLRQVQRGTAEAAEPAEKRATVVAAPHSNGIIIMGTPSQIQELKRIIALMDVDSPSGRGRLRAIFLRYISAEDAAKSLTSLLQGRKAAREAKRAASPISIQADAANNAILVDAMPRDFDLIDELVGELDRPPAQVLIEVLIAEISLQDELNVGISMMALDQPSEVGTTVVQGSSIIKEGADDIMNAVQSGLFPNGISVRLAQGNREDAAGNLVTAYPAMVNLDAIRKNGKFNIHSNVRLQTQNNREATVGIVNNYPILKSTISSGAGTARDVIQNIERIDVGIKLKLTPHINPDGDVLMALNPSIEAILDQGSVANGLAPIIAKREVSTTVSVPDGRTVVLSGLIREDERDSVRKVPLLGDIPLLGWLFRHKSKAKEKTDLLIFVTPHIAAPGSDAAWVAGTTNSAIAFPGMTNPAAGPAAPDVQ